MGTRVYARVAVHIVPTRLNPETQKDEVLLLLRQWTGFRDGEYGLVAGHVDEGEGVYAATIREAKEEAGIVVNPNNFLATHIAYRPAETLPNMGYMSFFFKVSTWEGEIQNMEPHKCGELRYFPIDALPPNIIPYIRSGLEALWSGVLYADAGWSE